MDAWSQMRLGLTKKELNFLEEMFQQPILTMISSHFLSQILYNKLQPI